MARQAADAASTVRCLHRWVLACVLAVVFGMVPPLSAAPIHPPLHVLFDPLNSVISGTLLERSGDRLVFGVEERLHGSDEIAGDRIEIAAPAWVSDALTVGDRYLVGYTPFVRDPQRVRVMIVSPRGPRLLVSPGLEPALYPDNSVYRDVLAYGRDGRIGEREDALATVFGWLRGDEPALQTLAAAQLTLDAKLAARLDQAGVRAIKDAFADIDLTWSARHWLYELARRHPDRFGKRWLRRAGIGVLETAPLTGYEAPVNAGDLVANAFLQADLGGWTVPEAALARWLRGDSPAMAERALLQMRRQDPALEAGQIERALARPDELAPPVRAFLEGHRQRLERMRERQRAG